MNRASSATGWVRNPTMKSPELDPKLASSYELGWTLNPLTGCKNHTPEGLCLGGMFPCYAYRLANGRLRGKYLANSILPTHDEPNHEAHHSDPFYPRFWPSRIDELARRNDLKPRGIFVCDMGELFGDWIPTNWQWSVFEVIKHNPQHRFYLLTKQPQNLIKWSPFPANCYVGVTATNPSMFTDACYYLKRIKATVKYISLEPLLEFSRLPEVLSWQRWIYTWLLEGGISQLIIGAQTKPIVLPQIEWVEEIVGAADKAGIPVFLKDNLWSLFNGSIYPVPLWAFDKESRLRQEMPG